MTPEVFGGNRKEQVNPGELGNLVNVRTFKAQTETFQVPVI